jgi:cysteine synthase A
VISGGNPGPHKIQGIGAGFIPKNCNTSIIDDVIKVENADAFKTAQKAALLDGLSVGISSGATIWAALELAKRPEMAGKRIVTIAASSSERYISTPLGEVARNAALAAVTS